MQARPRIWIGGNGEKRTLRIAARHADGWNTPYTSPEEFTRLSGVLDMLVRKEGRDPATIERNVNLSFHMSATPPDWTRNEAVSRDLGAGCGSYARPRRRARDCPNRPSTSSGATATPGPRA